uniref:Uncharacterized protein n=1 Tax=Knipowitschia caucasica TaxID=637954 RepID=A0AAV2KV26_KNICA
MPSLISYTLRHSWLTILSRQVQHSLIPSNSLRSPSVSHSPRQLTLTLNTSQLFQSSAISPSNQFRPHCQVLTTYTSILQHVPSSHNSLTRLPTHGSPPLLMPTQSHVSLPLYRPTSSSRTSQVLHPNSLSLNRVSLQTCPPRYILAPRLQTVSRYTTVPHQSSRALTHASLVPSHTCVSRLILLRYVIVSSTNTHLLVSLTYTRTLITRPRVPSSYRPHQSLRVDSAHSSSIPATLDQPHFALRSPIHTRSVPPTSTLQHSQAPSTVAAAFSSSQDHKYSTQSPTVLCPHSQLNPTAHITSARQYSPTRERPIAGTASVTSGKLHSLVPRSSTYVSAHTTDQRHSPSVHPAPSSVRRYTQSQSKFQSTQQSFTHNQSVQKLKHHRQLTHNSVKLLHITVTSYTYTSASHPHSLTHSVIAHHLHPSSTLTTAQAHPAHSPHTSQSIQAPRASNTSSPITRAQCQIAACSTLSTCHRHTLISSSLQSLSAPPYKATLTKLRYAYSAVQTMRSS